MGELRISMTGAGSSLSAFFNNKLTCHICASDSTREYEGMPVRRIPFATFQYVTADDARQRGPFAAMLLPQLQADGNMYFA